MAAVVGLHGTNPAQAVAAWQAIEPVAQGLGGSGGELLGGLWVLLVSVAALRTGALPKVLNWLGVAIGAAGVVSVVAGTQRRGIRLRLAGDRVVRVAGRGHAAHDFTTAAPAAVTVATSATAPRARLRDPLPRSPRESRPEAPARSARFHRLPPSPFGAGGVPPQGHAAGAEVPPTVDPRFRPPGDDRRRARP